MPDQLSLQSLWTRQEATSFVMTPADMEARSRRFHSRIQRRNWTEYAAAALVVAAFGAMAILFPDPWVKLGAALIALAAVIVAGVLHVVAGPGDQFDGDLAADLADYHRAGLVRQRDALASVWKWYLAPFVPGMLVFIGAISLNANPDAGLAERLAPFVVKIAFVGLVFGAIHGMNVMAARKLDAEISALDDARRN